MRNPLSKQQETLRGRKLADLTDEQLLDWIDACNKMERWVKVNKARRTWVRSRDDAEAELIRRKERQSQVDQRVT